MIFVRRVSGASMKPSLTDDQTVLCVSGRSCHEGDVVVARVGGREIIKRLTALRDDKVWLLGDNAACSTDSRGLGWINKSDILGVMTVAFPSSRPAPKVRVRSGSLLGWIAAGIMTGLVLVHLFRIDTFVPEMARIFGDRTTTLWLVSGIVVMEVFALPFLMRMRLSVLAQYVSGLFAVLVPLVWLLITIWAYGTGVSTAQLGEFVALPSNWLLLVLNVVWLVFSYYTIWALGYDHRPGEKQSFVTRWLSRLSHPR